MENWFFKYVIKTLISSKKVIILTTNTEPFFIDGQQAMFRYNGSEKLNKIIVKTVYQILNSR